MKYKNVLCIASMSFATACADNGSDLETNSISQGAGPCLTCGVGGEWQYMLRTQNRPNAHNSGELAAAYFLENDEAAKKYIAVRSLRPSTDGSAYGDREAHCNSSTPPYGVWGLDNTSKIRVAKCSDPLGTYQPDNFIYGKKIFLPANESSGYLKIIGLAATSDAIQTQYIVRSYDASSVEQRPYCTSASASASIATAISGIQPLVFLPIYLQNSQYRLIDASIHSEADFGTNDVLSTRMLKATRHDVISLTCPQEPVQTSGANNVITTLFKNGTLFTDFVLGGSTAAQYAQLQAPDKVHLILGSYFGIDRDGVGSADGLININIPFSKLTLQSMTASTNIEAFWTFDPDNLNNGAKCVKNNNRLNVNSSNLSTMQKVSYLNYNRIATALDCPQDLTKLSGTKFLQTYTESLAVNTPSWICPEASCYIGTRQLLDNSTSPPVAYSLYSNSSAYYPSTATWSSYWNFHPVIRHFKLVPYYISQAQWDAITDVAQAQDIIADASWRETLAYLLRMQTGLIIKSWKKYQTSSREEFYDRVRKEALAYIMGWQAQCRVPNSIPYIDWQGKQAWYWNYGECGYVYDLDINGTTGNDSGWEITTSSNLSNQDALINYWDLRYKTQEITGRDFSVVSYEDLASAVDSSLVPLYGGGVLNSRQLMIDNFSWAGGLPSFTEFKNANFIPSPPFSASTLVTALP